MDTLIKEKDWKIDYLKTEKKRLEQRVIDHDQVIR